MIIKLKPAFQSYLWGGERLKTLYGKKSGDKIIAEAWELSCHPHGHSTVASGADSGMTLEDWINIHGKITLGENCRRFDAFPVLVKLIDAKHNLSVQVHPGDAYARAHGEPYGKTEMWYVLDHEPRAFLYHGFKKDISRDEFTKAIEDGSLIKLLRTVEVKRGDVFFIEAGTIHAIGAGITVAEIQQNSNLTYRVFDYDRTDANGIKRELHIKQASDVTRITAQRSAPDFGTHLAACDYFTVDRLTVSGKVNCIAGKDSFRHLLITQGEGKVSCRNECVMFSMGDSLFVAAGTGKYEICGQCEVLFTSIP